MTFKITLDPSGRSYPAAQGKTVLDSGLEAGITLPYNCRAGTCRTCMGRIVEGKVDFGNAHPFYLTEDQKAAGCALLCKAKPLSDLVIQIEEVNLQHIKPRRVPCRVKRITYPAPDVAIVELRLPLNEHLRFAPGQFIDFLLPDGETRSYSIANAPHAEGVIDLELHIRHIPGGLFTDRLFSTSMEGSILEFNGPLGSFYLREESDKPIIFVASGTGLAPIKAIVEYAQQRNLSRPMKLYWGCRKPGDLYIDELVRGWKEALPNFDYVPVLSDALPEDHWQGRTGLVHQAVMNDIPDLANFQVYACGAPVMVDAARRDFVQSGGLPEREFFADSFVTAAEFARANDVTHALPIS
jgi:CDP-4-dehydro-6-deoxyglucose reductase, E3